MQGEGLETKVLISEVSRGAHSVGSEDKNGGANVFLYTYICRVVTCSEVRLRMGHK